MLARSESDGDGRLARVWADARRQKGYLYDRDARYILGSPMTSRADAIDEYIAAAALEAQPRLRRIREIVRAAAPEAEQTISYKIPAFRGRGVFIYFGAFKSHIGVFPPIHGDADLERALAPYRGPKGNLQFPLSEPLPEALIAEVVRVAVERDRAKGPARYRRERRR